MDTIQQEFWRCLIYLYFSSSSDITVIQRKPPVVGAKPMGTLARLRKKSSEDLLRLFPNFYVSPKLQRNSSERSSRKNSKSASNFAQRIAGENLPRSSSVDGRGRGGVETNPDLSLSPQFLSEDFLSEGSSSFSSEEEELELEDQFGGKTKKFHFWIIWNWNCRRVGGPRQKRVSIEGPVRKFEDFNDNEVGKEHSKCQVLAKAKLKSESLLLGRLWTPIIGSPLRNVNWNVACWFYRFEQP